MLSAIARLLLSGPECESEGSGETHQNVIARIVGPEAWLSLPGKVRERFSNRESTTYAGQTETKLSPIGRFFAWALFCFGSPIPVFSGVSAALVKVDATSEGMSWTRTYRGPFGLALCVHSIKRPSTDGRLFECCAGGWTMLLDVFADRGSLVFRSRQFYWRWGGVSIPLPLNLTPGIAEVRHTDLGGGKFSFTLSFDHPYFGRTIFQDGVFCDPEKSR